jgi:hypothetical protein
MALAGSLCLFATIISVLSDWHGRGHFASTDPEDGEFANNIYISSYFGLRYPLADGWSPGLQPPPPSFAGYYVLATPLPPEHVKATMLIAAQDLFFTDEASPDAPRFLQDLAQNLLGQNLGIGPTPVTIGGRVFQRLLIHETPLSRMVLAIEIRCHIVIFSFTGADFEVLETLAASLSRLSFEDGPAAPVCIKGYATAQTIRRRVDPLPLAPRFVTIPVRIIIGTNGVVRHIHVIRAYPEQRLSIENALAKWRFALDTVDGRPVEVETGLSFMFGNANTLPGGRP